MSDELQGAPANEVDDVDGEAPTQRLPVVTPPPPSRGAALSTLWWSVADDEAEQRSEA